jgi:catechol 2,3-dioxygenase-like lactoylglutathione lyase family enzyme
MPHRTGTRHSFLSEIVIDYNDFPRYYYRRIEPRRQAGAAALAIVAVPWWGVEKGGVVRLWRTQTKGVMAMALNHLNLTVPDVQTTRALFETYFGFRCVVARDNNSLAVLIDESGFILTLNNFDKATTVEYPGAFHIGFMQKNREQVDEMYERLKAGGFEAKPPHEFHGAWTFYFRAPGGFLVEVFYQHN